LNFWSTAEQLLEQQFPQTIGRRLCKEPLPIVLSEAGRANEAPDAHFPVNQLGFKRCRNIPFIGVGSPSLGGRPARINLRFTLLGRLLPASAQSFADLVVDTPKPCT